MFFMFFIRKLMFLSSMHQMFNVSTLLLDNALKPATPLTNGAINENELIFDEVKAYKNYAKFLGHPDGPSAGSTSTCRMLQLL